MTMLETFLVALVANLVAMGIGLAIFIPLLRAVLDAIGRNADP